MNKQPLAHAHTQTDTRTFLSGLIRKLPFVFVFVGIVAGAGFLVLDRLEPVYRSQARVLVDIGESGPAATTLSGGGEAGAIVDAGTMAGQIQLVRSRDLAEAVSEELNLASRAEFDPAIAKPSLVDTVLAPFGIGDDLGGLSVGERVLTAYNRKLSVYAIGESRVIGIDFLSTDPELAAAAANAIAERYVALRRQAINEAMADVERPFVAGEQGHEPPFGARIIFRAVPSAEPAFPRTASMTAAAAVAALILAIAAILMRERMRRRRPRRVGFTKTMPAVPGAVRIDGHMRWADDHSVRRMMPGEPTLAPALVDHVEESVVAIAGEILGSGAKRILVTLAEGCGDDGRPLAAVALARVLARTDQRAVVVDFRRDDANAASMGEGSDMPGFAELFHGEASFAQVIFRDRQSRVHFIPAGRAPLGPELLADERVETILSALTLTYDFVILDAPDDVLSAVGSDCAVAVVVSEFGSADPRTRSAFERVQVATAAGIQLLVVDAVLSPPVGETVERTMDKMRAYEAA